MSATGFRSSGPCSPTGSLEVLQRGRNRPGNRSQQVRWRPRTIEPDPLLYGEKSIASERLTVLHQELAH